MSFVGLYWNLKDYQWLERVALSSRGYSRVSGQSYPLHFQSTPSPIVLFLNRTYLACQLRSFLQLSTHIQIIPPPLIYIFKLPASLAHNPCSRHDISHRLETFLWYSNITIHRSIHFFLPDTLPFEKTYLLDLSYYPLHTTSISSYLAQQSQGGNISTQSLNLNISYPLPARHTSILIIPSKINIHSRLSRPKSTSSTFTLQLSSIFQILSTDNFQLARLELRILKHACSLWGLSGSLHTPGMAVHLQFSRY